MCGDGNELNENKFDCDSCPHTRLHDRNMQAAEIIAGLNMNIYSSATEAFNELNISPPVRREIKKKIIAWTDEHSAYIERTNAK